MIAKFFRYIPKLPDAYRKIIFFFNPNFLISSQLLTLSSRRRRGSSDQQPSCCKMDPRLREDDKVERGCDQGRNWLLIWHKILFCATLLVIFGCRYPQKNNDEFLKKYGAQVKKINLTRNKEIKKAINHSKENLSKNNYHPSDKQPVENNNSDNDFEIRYTGNYPAFRRVGAEFDEIHVPKNDVYGISTDVDKQKEYFIIGNNYLQKNIDDISNYPSLEEDIAISKILIAKKKQSQIKKGSSLDKEVIDVDLSAKVIPNKLKVSKISP